MVTFTAFLTIYLVGGLTFIPLVLCLVLAHAYYTFPIRDAQSPSRDEAEKLQLHTAELRRTVSEKDLALLPPGTRSSSQERDVAAGYFAVCREFVPGGVNGKPPERTTPAGEVVAVESPSVYQSMYRSIFDRNKVPGPAIEQVNGTRQATKKARNVFYIVLRLGHLMLYDDAEQLDVRHVISLALYEIDIYAGGEEILEGELFVKRNCIRLKRRQDREVPVEDSKPFCLFSDNCSEKEDFYCALLQNQDHVSGAMRRSPEVLHFETDHIIKLVQQLHASGENLQTRWINALIGRLFLSLYKTHELQELIHTKITKKITRVPKPSFIEAISVNKIDMGDSAPIFTNPKLRELTIDGDLTIETDVKYNGGFKLEIAAIATVDLGQRFKPRKINIVLSGICQRLEGHLLVRVKPPPSNRVWMSFETMPKLDLSIEPVVSSRQITYNFILRAIESKIREVVADTLVVPNWDDIPFSDTLLQPLRGGIWLEPRPSTTSSSDGVTDSSQPQTEVSETQIATDAAIIAAAKSASTPTLIGRRGTSAGSNKKLIPSSSSATGISSGLDASSGMVKPKSMRSHSFANAASPEVSLGVQARRESHPANQDAASMIKDIYSRSQNSSPIESPVGSPSASDLRSSKRRSTFVSVGSSAEGLEDSHEAPSTGYITSQPSDSSREALEEELAERLTDTSFTNTPVGSTKRQSLTANAASATAAARKWGFDLVAKHQAAKANAAYDLPPNNTSFDSTQTLATNGKTATTPAVTISSGLGSPSNPIGRGHPHGTPIPHASGSGAKAGWTAALGSLTKRKPVTIPSIVDKSGKPIIPFAAPLAESLDSLPSSPPPPPLPQRPDVARAAKGSASSSSTRRSIGNTSVEGGTKASQDDILIIGAPKKGENDVDIPDYDNAQAEAMEGIGAERRGSGKE
uniref:SMP-LTD domain-containing protein n=1 Tax=Venturia carpophila TaxID=86257 RepID=A0A6C0RIE7_9PEZI|nr:hypothetical protein [Venturia carpophila]QIA15781.1 hypothetical protein [Venturia carpophila]